jgi:hypothetical protein
MTYFPEKIEERKCVPSFFAIPHGEQAFYFSAVVFLKKNNKQKVVTHTL